MAGHDGAAAVPIVHNTPWRALSNESLINAMRALDPGAWDEFHQRFKPVLQHYARRIRIPAWLSAEYVDTALDDAALKLADGIQTPANVSGYLCRVLRNPHRMAVRSAARRMSHQHDAAVSVNGSMVVDTLCSHYALQASRGALALVEDGAELTLRNRARAALAHALRARLTDDERRLIVWVEDAVPCRDIASWLGISFDAAAKRITRLKYKLRTEAERCITALSGELQREVEHLRARTP